MFDRPNHRGMRVRMKRRSEREWKNEEKYFKKQIVNVDFSQRPNGGVETNMEATNHKTHSYLILQPWQKPLRVYIYNIYRQWNANCYESLVVCLWRLFNCFACVHTRSIPYTFVVILFYNLKERIFLSQFFSLHFSQRKRAVQCVYNSMSGRAIRNIGERHYITLCINSTCDKKYILM